MLNATGNIIRVTVNGATSGSCGSSWATACDLQYALTTVAASGDEVWVAQGVYKPTTGTDRSVSFQLRNGIALYGGFALTETLRDQRDWVANVTTLSGDIGIQGDNADNSYHVVIGSGVTNAAILDGFTVTQGNANAASFYPPYDFPDSDGGGMYSESSTATVRNTIFNANWAWSGGGMANEYSSPTLTNVTFSANSATYGGGMYNDISSPTISSTIFTDNSAEGYGGGMYNNPTFPSAIGTLSASITLTNVIFNANSALLQGGGIDNEDTAITLTNVTFNANSVSVSCGHAGCGGFGGGMVNGGSSLAILTNVTFSDNSASVWGGGIINRYSSAITLTNVTFTANSVGGAGGGMFNDAGHDTGNAR